MLLAPVSTVEGSQQQTGFVYGKAQTTIYKTYNTNSKVVGKIKRGEKLQSVKAISKNWYYVQYQKVKGYVKASEVVLDKKETGYTGIGQLKANVTTYVSANAKSKAVRTLKKSTKVTIQGIVGSWYKVKVGSGIEYIPNTNITVKATEKVSSFKAEGIIQSPANIVKAANALASVQTTYEAGTTIEIVGKSASFYKIRYKQSYAYVLINRVVIQQKTSYSDNSSKLYYELAKIAYKHYSAKEIESYLNRQFKHTYTVIDTIDLSKTTKHEMATSADGTYLKELNKSGFQAFVVVNPTNKRLYVAFAGSEQLTDFKQVAAKMATSVPAQAYDAHLYLNYIYDKYPKYRSYNWYVTGHSYGGYLATKVFLDAESKQVLIPSSRQLLYSGALRKKIQGVYTFNPVTMYIDHYANGQHQKNKKGQYNKLVHNLVYKDELVHKYYNKLIMGYVGTTTVVHDNKLILTSIEKHSMSNMERFTK